MHPFLLSLCAEYITLVDRMRQGQYAAEELPDLDSQRQTTHTQLREITGLGPGEDMYRHAKAVLLAARATGAIDDGDDEEGPAAASSHHGV